MATLGQIAKQARDGKGYTLATVCDIVEDLGAGKLDPTTLRRMETGERPGDAKVWGALWKTFGLPLRDLYEGLGLPVPVDLPDGTLGRLMAVAGELGAPGQEMVLMFAKQAPSYLAVAGSPRLDAAPDSAGTAPNEVRRLMEQPASVPEESDEQRLARRIVALLSLAKKEDQERLVAQWEAQVSRDVRSLGQEPIPAHPSSQSS